MNASFGMGPMELFLIAILTGSGTGGPTATPPGPEDPLMSRLAPAECLAYTTWAGMEKANPSSANRTEQMLADPEIQKFITASGKKVMDMIAQSAEAASPQEKARFEVLKRASALLAARPGMAYVADVKYPKGGPPDARLGFIFNVADIGEEIRGLLEKFKQSFEAGKITTVTMGTATFYRAQPDPKLPVITWGLRGRYLVGGVGEGEIERMMQRAKSEPPTWLTDVRARLAVPRISTVSYLNVAKVLKLIETIEAEERGAAENNAPPAKVFKAFGLDGLAYLAHVSGLDNKACVSRTAINLSGSPSGVLSWFDLKPLTPADVKTIPHDSPVGIVFKLDAAKAVAQVLAAVKEIEPEAAEQMTQQIDGVGAQLGFNLRQDVLASLGDTWRIYANPDAGGLLTGWTISAPVVNPQKLKPIYEQLMQMAQLMMGGDNPPPGAPAIKKTPLGTSTLYSVKLPFPGVPVTPSWCLTEKELLIGSTIVAVQEAAKGEGVAKSLANQPDVARYFGSQNKPLAVMFLDSRQLSETFAPMFQAGLNQAKSAGVPGLAPAGDDLPIPQAAMEKYLEPTVVVLLRTADGVELVAHQTTPLGNAGAMAPVAASMLLPAVQKAREAAQRTASTNNMKQILIAFHNYEGIYQNLPPAFSVDANGKPLLSWRVHILQLVEGGNELYGKFKFDEPWDSPNNKALIPLMPKVYRAAESKAAAGKTNYLGVRGKDGVFVPAPGAGGPATRGIKFDKITDGLSNTVAVVEVNDGAAVIWTKPDDFDPDGQDPLKVLVGLRPGSFLVGFADGAVRFLPATLPPATLKAIFTKSGGETPNLDIAP